MGDVKRKKSAASAALEKANREYYYGRGLCPWCGGKRKVAPGRRRCVICLAKDAERHRLKRNKDCRG